MWWTGLPVGATAFGIAAAVFLAATLIRPSILHPLNRAWMAFGNLLHRVVNPIVLGVIFYVVLTPMGVLMRLRGRDPMQRRLDPQSTSYWVHRKPPGPSPDSLNDQF